MSFLIRPIGVAAVDVLNRVPNLKGAMPTGGLIPARVHREGDRELFQLDIRYACLRWISVRGANRDTSARLVGVYGSDLKRVLGGGETVEGYHGDAVSRVRGGLAPGTYWVWVKARAGVESGRCRLHVGASFNIVNYEGRS